MGLKEGDVLNGKYDILREIGSGGMSTVWLAMDHNINLTWAVKEIHKDNADYIETVDEGKVLAETNLMKELDHPALPRIVDVIEDGDSICVVMDYIEGEPLSTVLKLYGPQEQDLVVEWMAEVCDVLDYLHHQDPPIIYRDMKPSNVMLKSDGNIKVIDFGIARRYKEGMEDTARLGTKGYASPEHFTGHTDVRSDVFTVGVTMYQMLTGKNPTEPPYEILPITQIKPNLSTGLEKIINKATKLNPDERYQTMSELKNAILNFRLLEEEYLNAYRIKIKKFVKLLSVSILCFLIGISLISAGSLADKNEYSKIIASGTADSPGRAEKLVKAIAIRPGDSEGYIELMKAYASDGSFSEDEASTFMSVFADNEDKIKKTSEYPSLCYKIGTGFLTYYTGKDSSSRNGLITAEPFFKNAENSTYAKMAQNYVYLAEFYQDYLIGRSGMSVKEPEQSQYKDLLKKCNNIIESLDSYKADDSMHVKYSTYEIILGLIENERNSMASAGIEKDDVMSLTGKIESRSTEMKPTVDVTIKKKDLVLSEVKEMKNMLNLTYKEAKTGGN